MNLSFLRKRQNKTLPVWQFLKMAKFWLCLIKSVYSSRTETIKLTIGAKCGRNWNLVNFLIFNFNINFYASTVFAYFDVCHFSIFGERFNITWGQGRDLVLHKARFLHTLRPRSKQYKDSIVQN